jgi:yeast amino acid transporter
MSPGMRVRTFFQAYLSVIIISIFFLVYKLRNKTCFKKVEDIDITTGRKIFDLEGLVEEERQQRAKWGPVKRVFKFFC